MFDSDNQNIIAVKQLGGTVSKMKTYSLKQMAVSSYYPELAPPLSFHSQIIYQLQRFMLEHSEDQEDEEEQRDDDQQQDGQQLIQKIQQLLEQHPQGLLLQGRQLYQQILEHGGQQLLQQAFQQINQKFEQIKQGGNNMWNPFHPRGTDLFFE